MKESGEAGAPPGLGNDGASGVSSFRWAVLSALVASNWTNTITAISVGLLLPAMTESMRLTDLQGGWLSASVRLGNMLVTFPAALFLSRFNPFKLSIVSAFLSALFALLHGLAPSYLVLLAARLGFGLSESAREPARAMLLQRWFPLKEIPTVNGITSGLTGAAATFTLMATPFILALTGGWRQTYYLYGAGATAVALLWLVVARRQSASSGPSAQAGPASALPYKALFRYPDLWLVGLGCVGPNFAWSAFATFWPTHMLESNQVPLTQSGFLFGLVTFSQVPSQMLVGYLASRLRMRRALLMGFGVLMAAAFLALLGPTQTWALALIALTTGIPFAFAPIATSIPFEIPGIQPREVAVGTSIIAIFMGAGGILGPVTAGAISDATGSLSTALVVAALMPLSLVLAPLAWRDRART